MRKNLLLLVMVVAAMVALGAQQPPAQSPAPSPPAQPPSGQPPPTPPSAATPSPATPPAGQQQPPPSTQPPVFRGGTNQVRVDVTVLDRKGEPVTNLTKDDFDVREDGIPQTIDTL